VVNRREVLSKMRRTKKWWASLSRDERKQLVHLEKAFKEGCSADGRLPEGSSACPGCGEPQLVAGPCADCSTEHARLLLKADMPYERR